MPTTTTLRSALRQSGRKSSFSSSPLAAAAAPFSSAPGTPPALLQNTSPATTPGATSNAGSAASASASTLAGSSSSNSYVHHILSPQPASAPVITYFGPRPPGADAHAWNAPSSTSLAPGILFDGPARPRRAQQSRQSQFRWDFEELVSGPRPNA